MLKKQMLLRIKKFVMSYFPVLVASMYSLVFLLCKNISEVTINDLIFPVSIMLLVSAGTYLMFVLLFRDVDRSVFCAALVSLVFANYKLLHQLFSFFFPGLRYWHFAGILLFTMGWLFFFYRKYISIDVVAIINQVLMLVFTGLILVNGISSMPHIIDRVKAQSSRESGEVSLIDTQKKSEGPNFYHFIMDEFSAPEIMKTYYDYDPSWFFEWLEEKGFAVGHNNRNETIDTTTILTNLMNLDYIVDNGTPSTERERLRKDAVLPKYLKGQGYEIIGLGSAYDEFNVGEETVKAKAVTVGGKSFEYLFFDNTVVYPFISSVNIEERNKILNAFEWFEDEENLSGNGKYVLTYLLLPHEPFFFDENGGFVDETNHNNWKDKQYYLGQYIYCCKMLQQAIGRIVENDPHAVIMLHSDHSARAADDYELYLKWIGIHDARRCVNAVYFGGEEFQNIDEISSLNTMRAVLTRLFDTEEYPPVEEPDYYDWQGGVFE